MSKVETRKQRQVVREELQLMKEDWMKEMKTMMKEEFLKEIKIMMKEEIEIEKDSLKEAVESIKKIKLEVNKAVDFMNEQFELYRHENKQLKGKVNMLMDKNKELSDQLKEMKEETSSSNLQIDYIERNLKSRNVEISGVPYVQNENVFDLAMKVITKIDPHMRGDDIEYVRRLKKKGNNKDIIQGSILVRFKNINKRNYIFRNKKNLAEAKLNSEDTNITKVFINENLTPKNKNMFYKANCFRKDKNWKFVWTNNGVVYLREKEGSNAFPIRNLIDIKKLDS